MLPWLEGANPFKLTPHEIHSRGRFVRMSCFGLKRAGHGLAGLRLKESRPAVCFTRAAPSISGRAKSNSFGLCAPEQGVSGQKGDPCFTRRALLPCLVACPLAGTHPGMKPCGDIARLVQKTVCTRILADDCGMTARMDRSGRGYNPFRVEGIFGRKHPG
jgi:hypothetical protein